MTNPKPTTAQALDHAALAHAELSRYLRVEVYRIVAEADEPVGTLYVAGELKGDLASAVTFLEALAVDNQLVRIGDRYAVPSPRQAA